MRVPNGSTELDMHSLSVVTKFEDPDLIAFVFSSLMTVSGMSGFALREYGWMITSRDSSIPSNPGSPQTSVFQSLYRQTPTTQTGVPFPRESPMAQIQECMMKSQNERMRVCVSQFQNALLSEFSEGVSL